MAEINPHIPQFIQSAPWYLETGEKPSLDHQRKRQRKEGGPIDGKAAKTTTFQAEKYRKGACENCGAMTHDRKLCTERPRKLGAKFTNKQIAPDEKILEEEEVDYDAKRDKWNGGNVTGNCFDSVLKRYAACDAARRKYLIGEAEGDDDDFTVDEGKVVYFAKVEKRVRTTGDGGSTGSVRNLRIREDTAKYLLDLDFNSAYYDPKTRSMREDPLPEADPNEKFYGGDNRCRNSGQALEFKQVDLFSFGQDHIHLQAAPSQAEFLYKNHKNMKEKLRTRTKDSIFEKYGNVASDQEEMPREVLLGQSERQVEYDRAGRIIKGQDQTVLPKSKYELHVCNINNNHTSVWGSWWKDHQWGYKCCKQVFQNSYCTCPAKQYVQFSKQQFLYRSFVLPMQQSHHSPGYIVS